MAPHQGAVGTLRQREDAFVVTSQQLLLDILAEEELLRVVHLVERVRRIVTDVREQPLGRHAALPRDMVESLGPAIADRLRRGRHLGMGARLDHLGEDRFQRLGADVGIQRGAGVERIVERRRVSIIDRVVDQHPQRQIAEAAIFVEAFGHGPLGHHAPPRIASVPASCLLPRTPPT
jgi:hypothetical protein